MTFKVGDKVKHLIVPRWGIGTIINSSPNLTIHWQVIDEVRYYNKDGSQGKGQAPKIALITPLEKALL